jgi:hypothetical protein
MLFCLLYREGPNFFIVSKCREYHLLAKTNARLAPFSSVSPNILSRVTACIRTLEFLVWVSMSYINTRYIASRCVGCGAILPGNCPIFCTDQLTKACWIENTKFHYTQNKSLPLDRFLNHLHTYDVHVVALMKMSRRVQRLMCVTCSARDLIFALLANKTTYENLH